MKIVEIHIYKLRNSILNTWKPTEFVYVLERSENRKYNMNRIKQNLEKLWSNYESKLEDREKNRELMYLLVKNIPAQKLPTQRKIIHFWDITLLGSRSPLLFQVIDFYIYFSNQSSKFALKRQIPCSKLWAKLKKLEKRRRMVEERKKTEIGQLGKEGEDMGRAENRERKKRNQNREVVCFSFCAYSTLFVPFFILCHGMLCFALCNCVILFSLSLSGLVCVSVWVFAGKGRWTTQVRRLTS